jgi:diguanylate cyclase (GGDEF)-like protein/PAS domain S-box-containing protein
MTILERPLTTPSRILGAVAGVVFVAEAAVMLAIERLAPPLPRWAEALLDAAALTALVSAFLWAGVIGPLRRALESEQGKARIIVDNASEGIVTIDERGVIRAFNRAAERLFGYAADEAIGRNVSLLIPAPEKARHDGYLERYRRTGRRTVVNTTRQVDAERKGGEVFPVEMSMSEVRAGGERLFTAIIRDITERRAMEERVRQLAHFDALTGLPNRVLFFDRLRQAAAQARRGRHRLGLLYIDLDKFKPVNDAYGHHVGDLLLGAAAERLRALLRESDTVARLGGDEFSVLLPAIGSREDAEAVAEKIGCAFGAPFLIDDLVLPVGASVGVVLYPDDASFVEVLLKLADQRMYRSKGERRLRALDNDDPLFAPA